MILVIATTMAVGAAYLTALIAIDHLYPTAEAILTALTPFVTTVGGDDSWLVVLIELFMPLFPILAPIFAFIVVFFGVTFMIKRGGSV